MLETKFHTGTEPQVQLYSLVNSNFLVLTADEKTEGSGLNLTMISIIIVVIKIKIIVVYS
jgi:hypothetical protein